MTEAIGLVFIGIFSILACHMLLTRRRSIKYSLAVFILNTLVVFYLGLIAKANISNPVAFEYTLTAISFLYFVYIYLVFSESIPKKVFTMFSVWIYSFMSFLVSVHLFILLRKVINDKYFNEYVMLSCILIQLALLTALYFWLGKPYKRVISIVPNKVISFMFLYPFIAYLLMKCISYIITDNIYSIYFMLLFLVFIILGYFTTFVGISASSKVELQSYMANYDYVTGIMNRANIMNQLEKAIEVSYKSKLKFALLICDLDDFKKVNDEYGHLIGDKVLKCIAQAIRRNLRSTDSIGRYGGDEFIIIQQFIGSEEDVKSLLSRIFEELKLPFIIDGKEIPIKLSVGISIFPDYTSDFETLINQADSAMYEAKKRDGINFSFYNSM